MRKLMPYDAKDNTDPFPKVTNHRNTLKLANSYTSCSIYKPVLLRKDDNEADDEKYQTISERFRMMCRKYEHCAALAHEYRDDINVSSTYKWCFRTYGEYDRLVDRAAVMLLNFGLKVRGTVAIISWNCPNWLIAELAIIRVGGVAIGIYPTSTAHSIYEILAITEVTIVFVENRIQMDKIRSIKELLPKIKAVIYFEDKLKDMYKENEGYYNWCTYVDNISFSDELMIKFKKIVEKRESNVAANECALIVFSSGTDGWPKYVMLSHDNIIQSMKTFTSLFPNLRPGGEVVLSYLPLNHIAAQIFEIFLPIELGALVYFSRFKAPTMAIRKLLIKTKPTLFFGVPALFEDMMRKYLADQKYTNFVVSRILQYAKSVVLRYNLDRMHEKPDTLLSNLNYRLATKVLEKMNRTLGLENCNYIFMGGALAMDNLKTFFLSMNMRLIEVYGLSETSGGIAFNNEFKCVHTVGRIVDSTEVKIHEPNVRGEGEICVRGRRVCMGYFKAPGKTSANIDADGWVHTGDWGFLNMHGYLYIVDRIKNLIITASGQNILLDRIVNSIYRQLPCVSYVVIAGDNRRYLTALLTLKTLTEPLTEQPEDELSTDTINWLESLDINVTRLSQIINDRASNYKEIIIEAIEEAFFLVDFESDTTGPRVLNFTILAKGFSVTTGELELRGKRYVPKRSSILEKYAAVIDAMYEPGFQNKFL